MVNAPFVIAVVLGVALIGTGVIRLVAARHTSPAPVQKFEVGQCTVVVTFTDLSEHRVRLHGDVLWLPSSLGGGVYPTTALEKARNFISNNKPIEVGGDNDAAWAASGPGAGWKPTIFIPRHMVVSYRIENESSFEVTTSRA
jgi:hypothetical protein